MPLMRPLLSFSRAVVVLAAVAVLLAPGALCVRADAQAPAAAAAHDPKDLAGNWQGTLTLPKTALRLVLQIAKGDKGWTGKFYSIDQKAPPLASAIVLTGADVKVSVDIIGGTFTGKVSPDGNSMVGTWTQGQAFPLTLVRATKETAWEIPAPPPPPKLMAPDADPAFDVATIKPNDSGATNMQGLVVQGRQFLTRASSLDDLLAFAYNMHLKQIVNAPDWAAHDRYDISAVPDAEGTPSVAQLRTMVQKLIKERWKLTFHKEQREMQAYVITVGKDGLKVKETQVGGPLPGAMFRPAPAGLTMQVVNATPKEFGDFLQGIVLDRPVVDHTGVNKHFDFSFTFTPDDTQFNGHPPPLPAKTDTTETEPGIFEALPAQTGFKIDAQKTAVDVLVIDHVEKPSAN